MFEDSDHYGCIREIALLRLTYVESATRDTIDIGR